MSDCRRTVDEVEELLHTCKDFDSQQTLNFYNSWAATYEQDVQMLDYRAPHLGVEFLNAKFSGKREEVRVLDVACGSGLVAKLMSELGFRHFVGVDGSTGMLEKAAKTGLYQDLRLAVLGTEPLPAQSGTFDVVIIVGCLDVGFAPVGVVKELCDATKPGGLVCIVRGNHKNAASEEFKKDLERELQLLETEGLWTAVEIQQVDRYMANHEDDKTEEPFISGSIYLYKKSSH